MTNYFNGARLQQQILIKDIPALYVCRISFEKIPCVIPGCTRLYHPPPTYSLSPSVRFLCRYHQRRAQVEAIRKYDPLKDHRDERVHFDLYQLPYKNGQDPGGSFLLDFTRLQQSMDREEPFFTANQIVKPRTDVERQHDTPLWMFDDKSVLAFIQNNYPNLGSCKAPSPLCACMACRRLSKATKWYLVIQNYFRMYKTESQIEDEIPALQGQVGDIRKSILRVVRGLNQDGTAKTGRPRGRPKRIIPASSGTEDAQKSLVNSVTVTHTTEDKSLEAQAIENSILQEELRAA